MPTDIKKGWIEIICGPMFSGKTEELIRRLKRALIANNVLKIFKPAIDNRYSSTHIVSHNKNSIESEVVEKSIDILKKSKDADVVGIDEVQFFDDDITDIANQLADKGKRVIIAGLDRDYLSNPFDSVSQLLSNAEVITKLNAICILCGDKAFFSNRISDENKQLLVGEKDKYEALCRECFNKKRNN